jgi:hypothetical protein
MVDDLTQVITAADLVLQLAEDLADLVFNRVRTAGLLFDAVQVWEQLPVDEITQVVTSHRAVVVDLAVLALRCGPFIPAIAPVEDIAVFPAIQPRLGRLVLLQPVQVFQEQQPGGLLGVIQLGGTTGLFSEHIINIFERLFEHGFFGFVGFSGKA